MGPDDAPGAATSVVGTCTIDDHSPSVKDGPDKEARQHNQPVASVTASVSRGLSERHADDDDDDDNYEYGGSYTDSDVAVQPTVVTAGPPPAHSPPADVQSADDDAPTATSMPTQSPEWRRVSPTYNHIATAMLRLQATLTARSAAVPSKPSSVKRTERLDSVHGRSKASRAGAATHSGSSKRREDNQQSASRQGSRADSVTNPSDDVSDSDGDQWRVDRHATRRPSSSVAGVRGLGGLLRRPSSAGQKLKALQPPAPRSPLGNTDVDAEVVQHGLELDGQYVRCSLQSLPPPPPSPRTELYQHYMLA